MKVLRNFFGAFGDAAILFPIIALLNTKTGFSVSLLLASSAVIYIFSSLFFRIPMPVQPLKSIAMAAVSVGASMNEIRISAIVIGLFCVSLLVVGPKLENILAKIPNLIIHQLQVGLGVLLLIQGIKAYGQASIFSFHGVLIIGFVLVLVLKSEVRGFPILGVIATVAFFMGLYQMNSNDFSLSQKVNFDVIAFDGMPYPRWPLILSLVLPQIALTMGNSVLSTKNICDRLYPQAVNLPSVNTQPIDSTTNAKVTYRKLLGVIGFGNILVGILGGMPFCHGSGGVTAHSRAGATHWLSTFFLGFVLLIISLFIPSNMSVVIPAFFLTVLLITVGIFHLKLSNLSWKLGGWNRVNLVASALIVLWTQNLLWVFPIYIISSALKKMGVTLWLHIMKR